MKSVSKIVGALSISALAGLGCSSKEEKPAETDSSKAPANSCGAAKPAEGSGDKGKASCGAGKK